ncbi:elongation factor P hydroxylase [Pistricoccus aurantiacus]|uniref:Elongation factor P hydroxylase n=1 Tax=Pistricoccus aurantiacus TaxID=1883414 RepID=A0A5B8SW80_9GAMM|nr:elongation factor P hydroxylase [Pistricoccus aurantiacus]QEA40387.1 elongation factor P hydroxylase [Pistricoccus aurantiacus]
MTYRLDDIIALFDGLFHERYLTRLIAGGEEPLYLPADDETAYHRVIFAQGYFASALHEISHWCIAGEQRRQFEDYGYWYLPDGRDASQQRAFETAEMAPQALELLFSRACGLGFNVSIDNLGELEVDRDGFRERVEARAVQFEREGLPYRAEAFRVVLRSFYGHGLSRDQAILQGRRRLRKDAEPTYPSQHAHSR